MQTKEDSLLTLLEDAGLLTRSQIEAAALKAAGDSNVTDLLIQEGVLSDVEVSRTRAAQAQMDWLDLSTRIIPPEVISQIRPEDARRFKVIPTGFGEAGLIVAVRNPLDIETIDSLSFLLQREIELVCASSEDIRQALIKYYGTADEASDVLLEQIGHDVDIDLEIMQGAEIGGTDAADASIIRMVSMIVIEAYRLGASDIHLEPLEKRLRVRFRIDGVLQEMPPIPKRLHSAIVSRIKIMTGSISIAEKRLPQDGRIQVRVSRKPIDLRVSTIPTNHGESVVLRLLDRSILKLDLSELGLFQDDQEQLERFLCLPDGIVLVTGPTGSGKTSTLYSCLNYLNKPDCKIITVEEPVEYQLSGINQVQVNIDAGMTFPVALRSILRQAPNIIMIGEIRDLETAVIATNASLIGHLVFSTLHTNDAPSTVARLIDIGVQPFLVASSIRVIIAQRLVRRLCPACKQPIQLSKTEASVLDLDRLGQEQIMAPIGCEKCRHTGYRGRLGIFEILLIDDEARYVISQRCSTPLLRQHARRLGMRTLREDGVRKICAGLTSVEEIIANTTENEQSAGH